MIIKKIEDLNVQLLNTWLNFEIKVVDLKITKTFETVLSTFAHITVEYEKPNSLPKYFFMKMTMLKADGKPNGRGKKEVKFYKELSGIINEKNVPKCYFSESDDEGFYNILVDDISISHDTQRWDGENLLKQYKLVAECLAEIHAKWWDHEELESIVGKKLSYDDWDSFYNKSLQRSEIFIENHKGLFKPEQITTYHTFKNHFAVNINRYLSGKNMTLQHRDPHFWNFMYPKDQKGSVYLIDWDSYRIDVPTHDIAYFIAVHFSLEERAENENAILKYYYEQLVIKGVKNYSFNELIRDYKTSVLSMIFLSPFKESIGIPEKVWRWQFKNIMNAIEDLNCIELVKEMSLT